MRLIRFGIFFGTCCGLILGYSGRAFSSEAPWSLANELSPFLKPALICEQSAKPDVCMLLNFKQAFEANPTRFCPELKSSTASSGILNACYQSVLNVFVQNSKLDLNGFVLIHSVFFKANLETQASPNEKKLAAIEQNWITLGLLEQRLGSSGDRLQAGEFVGSLLRPTRRVLSELAVSKVNGANRLISSESEQKGALRRHKELLSQYEALWKVTN